MIDEHDLREILHRRASTITAGSTDPRTAIRRARHRQILTGSASAIVAVGLAVGALTGLKALEASRRTPLVVPTPSPVVTTDERVGFTGLAPEGSEASLPAVGELVISFDNFCCPGQTLSVYSDGRMIWSQGNVVEPGHEDWVDLVPQRANRWDTGYLEQRLTRKGVELLRSELLSTGLFEKSVTFKAGEYGLGIAVRNDGRMIRLWGSSDRDPVGATPEEAEAIERVAALLKDPEAWLPDDAWADRTIRAFIPSRYIVVMHFYSSGGRTPDDPSELPPPADDLLRAADIVDRSSACQIVTVAEARQIHAGLRSAFGSSPASSVTGLSIPYGGVFGTPVTIESALPHQRDCASAGWRG